MVSNGFKIRDAAVGHNADDGTYIFVGKSRLLRSVRDIKNKSN